MTEVYLDYYVFPVIKVKKALVIKVKIKFQWSNEPDDFRRL